MSSLTGLACWRPILSRGCRQPAIFSVFYKVLITWSVCFVDGGKSSVDNSASREKKKKLPNNDH